MARIVSENRNAFCRRPAPAIAHADAAAERAPVRRAERLAALLALLPRLRDLNTELVAKLAVKSRQRPPSETWRRLPLELPFALAAAANEDRPALSAFGSVFQ